MAITMSPHSLLLLSLLLVLCLSDSGDFGYQSNGADWHETCEKGKSQSPIDLTGYQLHNKFDSKYLPLRIDYSPVTSFAKIDAGSDYKVTGGFGTLSAVNVDRTGIFNYTAAQFHFHAPAEHLLDNQQYPLEMHIVHVLSSSTPGNSLNLAVLGVFFEIGPFNPILAEFIAEKPKNIDLKAFFGSDVTEINEYFMYKGSLTTPPCTEAVNWYVYAKPVQASVEQIDYFEKKWAEAFEFAHGKGNNRKLQKLNERELIKYSGATALIAGLAMLIGI